MRDYGTPGQIGLEATPDAYVSTMVAVFAEVWRVLRDDGTVWLNLGDSYAGGGGYAPDAPVNVKRREMLVNGETQSGSFGLCYRQHERNKSGGIKPQGEIKAKDLVGIPWRVAFALQAAGWYLRADIIWAKPNPMPESVTDRPTKAHEYIFLLSKQERYVYNADAIAESTARMYSAGEDFGGFAKKDRLKSVVAAQRHAPSLINAAVPVSRNKRSVWTVPTQPFSGAHFATFPEALIEPCILAGSRPGDLVLDPFIGSGTVGAVCERFGRRWVGTDLSYQGLSTERTAQRGLRFGD